jgi:hypothetical protein
LIDEKPELDEEEQTYENLWKEQSFEDYYSSQEGEEVSTDSEEELINDEGNDNPEIYVTRSGKKSKPPERLQYDVQSCLLSLNDHKNEETWSEQHLLAYKASTHLDTVLSSSHETTRQREIRRSYAEGM